ncbi:MAG TPA: protein kinase, partial [Thermoanaerobaculia bacterium]|nr:protein kinase [Thermoanaerobaculia bacterium]
MPLSSGARLGPYEIQSLLGAGGMGEVYRARDSKLGRSVAIKVLPESVAQDPERLARFEREAQVLASLNHPNIATIHGVEDSGATHALVMELVEGPTLEDRIAQGPIPLDEALPIARQIAEGLDFAHERGIIHRDLKPANVKLTPDGAVKILDFGLAKALDPGAGGSSPDVTHSPTITAAATRSGVILGTAAYMSPEQARGKPADKRADIWAFGCVLWQMLTGKRLFHGETVSDTLAAVLRADIDWAELPAGTPPAIRRLLERCLDRDPRRRLRDIGEARIALEGAPASFIGAPPDAAVGTPPPRFGWGRMAASALAGGLLVAVVAAGIAAARHGRSSRDAAVRLNISLPRGKGLLVDDVPNFALSRDGAQIAYVAKKDSGTAALFLRSMSSFDAKELPETEGAISPFFSPDGQWLAYVLGGRLQKMAVAGGPAQPV